jgi:hypothetical protein
LASDSFSIPNAIFATAILGIASAAAECRVELKTCGSGRGLTSSERTYRAGSKLHALIRRAVLGDRLVEVDAGSRHADEPVRKSLAAITGANGFLRRPLENRPDLGRERALVANGALPQALLGGIGQPANDDASDLRCLSSERSRMT